MTHALQYDNKAKLASVTPNHLSTLGLAYVPKGYIALG
jgi:hypothetical protein